MNESFGWWWDPNRSESTYHKRRKKNGKDTRAAGESGETAQDGRGTWTRRARRCRRQECEEQRARAGRRHHSVSFLSFQSFKALKNRASSCACASTRNGSNSVSPRCIKRAFSVLPLNERTNDRDDDYGDDDDRDRCLAWPVSLSLSLASLHCLLYVEGHARLLVLSCACMPDPSRLSEPSAVMSAQSLSPGHRHGEISAGSRRTLVESDGYRVQLTMSSAIFDIWVDISDLLRCRLLGLTRSQVKARSALDVIRSHNALA